MQVFESGGVSNPLGELFSYLKSSTLREQHAASAGAVGADLAFTHYSIETVAQVAL